MAFLVGPGFIGRLAPVFPGLGFGINGVLADAVVVDIAAPAPGAARAGELGATVAFTLACRNKSGAPCEDITTTVMLPAADAARIAPGDLIPVTYLAGNPRQAMYGMVERHWFVGDTVTMVLMFTLVPAFVVWTRRAREQIAAYRLANGRALFLAWALFAGLVAIGCFKMTGHLLRWEIGMTYAKRLAPSQITELDIRNGDYHAKYTGVMEDGRGFWRVRDFDASEIDDFRKMKVGRKFDVVYIEGSPNYNRPDWVEAIHAPERKMWIALWGVAGVMAVSVGLLGFQWVLGGPEPPPALARRHRGVMGGPPDSSGERFDPPNREIPTAPAAGYKVTQGASANWLAEPP